MREYNALERKSAQFLVNKRIDFTTIQITQTGINKSTLDATAPVRTFFKEHGIHDFERQAQGQENKISKKTYVVREADMVETTTTMFRPTTKKGDPRIWIYGFRKIAHPDDILAILEYDGIIYVIVLTQIDIEKIYNSSAASPLREVIDKISQMASTASMELLGLIREKMSDWIPSEKLADTGIGRTIESCLGISMNSRKIPDYKGIELKSKRIASKVRNTLFTQAPNWKLSKFKSAKEICAKYGYYQYDDGVKRMHVTLKARHPNPQHLALSVSFLADLLEANEYALDVGASDANAYKKVNDVVVWQMMALHKNLLTKHHETFWIDVENKVDADKELFRVKDILHTKNPLVNQFDTLLEQGHISVDFLLCRRTGGDTYSFKIDGKSRSLLFPQSETYIING